MGKPHCSPDPAFSATGVPAHTGPYEAVIIGASFGGPPAVAKLLGALPADFPAPVAICQHIAAGFTTAWAERLSQQCRLPVKEATDTMRFEARSVYIAPAGFQTRVARGVARRNYFRVDPDFADSLYVPSVDILMSSAAQVFGSRVLAVLLTGLGHDGACGMLAVREVGGYTIAESEATAASYSMPGAAAAMGAVVEVLPLDRLIARVVELGGLPAER